MATSRTKSISGLKWIHEARLSTHLQSRRKLRMVSNVQLKDVSAFSSVLTDRSTSEWMPELSKAAPSINFSQFLEDFLHARRWMNARRAASGNWSMQQNSTLHLSMPEDGHSQAHMPSARRIPPVLWHWQRLDITPFHQQLSVRSSCARSLLFCEGFTRDWHRHRSPAALQ